MPLSFFTDRSASDSTQPLLPPDERVLQHQSNVQFVLSHPKLSPHLGSLFITSKHLIFLANDTSVGYRIDFPSILMHAISREGGGGVDKPHIYCQFEAKEAADEEEMYNGDEEEDDDNGEGDEEEEEEGAKEESAEEILARVTEARLVPEDPFTLDLIFHSMSDAAALNPDPVIEGEGEFFFDSSSAQIANSNNTTNPNISMSEEESLSSGIEELEHEEENEYEEEEEMYQDAEEEEK